MRILLIEDDTMVGRGVEQAIRDAGLSVDWVRDGEAGLEALRNGGHGLVLLDLGLPGSDGLEVLSSARSAGLQTPIVIITARDGLDSRIAGLDLGADDYIVKPFEVQELLARIRAVSRRHAGQAKSVLEAGLLMLDLSNNTVRYKDNAETLPPREFALLRALAERPGTILSKSTLEDRIYGWGEEVESNAVEVLIYYIRKKFGKDVILNVRGAGWMIPKE